MHRIALATLLFVALVPSAAATTPVRVMGGYFDPDVLEVLVGEEIVWTNEDSMPHTVTSTWDSGASFDAVLRGGESFAWSFNATGEFLVHCRPHAYPDEASGMEGMAMSIHAKPLESAGEIGRPVPGAGVAIAIVGLLCATTLLRRRAP